MASPAPLPIPPSPAPAAGRLTTFAPLTAVLVVGALAYANALGGAFVFDDLRNVRDNPLVRDLGGLLSLQGLRGSPHRWAALVTFAVNYRLGGVSPVGYHAFNVAVHLANAALVYALVLLAFRTPRLAPSALAGRARAVAFVAAALFVAHPIQTQAVTYVVQRMTSLATLFYLGAVVLYLRWRLATSAGARRPATYASILLVALLAMLTKEIAFTLPFAVALAEVAFFRTTRRDLLRLLPILVTAVVVPATWLAGSAGPTGSNLLATTDAITRVQTGVGRLDYLATQLAVIVTYLFLLILPIGQNLDHDYPVHHSFLAPEVLSGAVVLAALAGLAAWLLARTRAEAPRPLDPAARLAGFGIAWWFLALSVESSVIPIVDVINEHRVYLPSAGLLAAAAIGIANLAARLSAPEAVARRTAAVGAALAILLAGATVARNRVWHDDLALWTDAARKSPGKSRPWLDLGTALREAGRPDAAVAALRRGLERDPDSSYGHAQLGAVLLSLGRRDEAEPELRAALRVTPDDPEALFNFATLLWETGRRDDARPLYASFARIAPAAYGQARRIAALRAADPAQGGPPAGTR